MVLVVVLPAAVLVCGRAAEAKLHLLAAETLLVARAYDDHDVDDAGRPEVGHPTYIQRIVTLPPASVVPMSVVMLVRRAAVVGSAGNVRP